MSYQEIEREEEKDGGEDADEVRFEGLALWCGFHYLFLFYHLHFSFHCVRPCNIDRIAEDGEMLLVGFLLDIDCVADCFDGDVSLNNDRVESEL